MIRSLRKEVCIEMGERQAIYQVSTLQALARGNYYGSTDMETLLTHGDTGLGTFHAVGGELIVIDGHAYRVLGDGSAVEAATSDTTPFATVTWLREQVPVILKRQPSIEALKDILTEQVRELGINDVYIVRIDGHFRSVSARTELEQQEPYLPFAKVLEKDERRFTFEDIDGSLIGIYIPDYLSGVNTSGWHSHFISADRKKGGHVFDLDLEEGRVIFNKADRFILDMPHNKQFERGDLTAASQEEIKQIEQGK